MSDENHPILQEKAEKTAAIRRAPQIRPRLQEACRLIVSEGLSIADAARRSGMTPHSLQVALKKPHVASFLAHVKTAWLESRTSKAWLNMAELADRACSEDVRFKANKTFLEAAGELGRSGDDGAGMAKTLVQIVINHARGSGHLPDGQMSGVIEAKPYQPLVPLSSNSHAVGREDLGGDDEE